MTIGEFIRERREAKGLGLRRLAALVPISAPFLSDIELGRRQPSPDTAEKIAAALGINTKRLMAMLNRTKIAQLENEIRRLRRAS
jgi:transcriptional regulator with XRE-family HTH domain